MVNKDEYILSLTKITLNCTGNAG